MRCSATYRYNQISKLPYILVIKESIQQELNFITVMVRIRTKKGYILNYGYSNGR
jgi:inorganic pyrophosphatase